MFQPLGERFSPAGTSFWVTKTPTQTGSLKANILLTHPNEPLQALRGKLVVIEASNPTRFPLDLGKTTDILKRFLHNLTTSCLSLKLHTYPCILHLIHLFLIRSSRSHTPSVHQRFPHGRPPAPRISSLHCPGWHDTFGNGCG
jgi:hypothetical protein